MSGFQVLTVLGLPLGLYDATVMGMLTLLTCVVLVVTYITASCKLQSVLEATMQGSANGGGGTTDSTARSRASSSSSTRSNIIAHTKSWVSKSSGAKGQKRHKHLATIMTAARGIVVCFVFYLLSVIMLNTQPQGFARTACGGVSFAMLICANIVLLHYYRAAIMSGATRRRRGSSTDAGGTSENNTVTSVVPVSAASTVGEELEQRDSITESNSSTDTPSSASENTDAPGLPGTVNAPDTPTTALRKLIDGE
jgi:hypothetical protein